MRIRLPFFRKKEKKEKTEEKPVYVFDDSLSANSLANRAYCHIEELSQIGPRKAGSVSSRMAANNIAAKLEEHSGDVSVMPLSIDSSSMLIWPKVVALLIPLSVVFLFVGLPYVALIPEIMAFVLIYLAGIEGKAVFSRFIKKSDGENVRARIEAETEEAKRVVITAHHDSAVLYRRKEHALDLYIPLLSISFIFVLTMFLLLHEGLSNNLLSLNLPSVFPLIFILISAVLSALSLRLFSLFSTDVSPGCGDNLSGVGVLISLAEYFSKRRLKRVSLDFISFDAEEFGCQGSQDYFSKNRYPEGTIVINIDGLYSADKLSILSFLSEWKLNKDSEGEGSGVAMDEESFDAMESLDAEILGIHDILNNDEVFDSVKIGGIFIDGRLRAFSIGNYNPAERMAIIDIEKADPEINGLYQMINREFLVHEFPDAEIVNREDDVGLPGLRKAKLSYCPIGYERKYMIIQNTEPHDKQDA